MTTTTLQEKGFGVFATYTDATAYASVSAKPNFMYNQQVGYTAAGGWAYSPLKYWPNETIHDSQSPAAVGPSTTSSDKLSFFAYAPWVNVKNTGALNVSGTVEGTTQVGITGVSDNDATGDPTVSYTVAQYPKNSVDLLWGVAPVGGLEYKAVNGLTITVPEGAPLLNLVKPSTDQKMKFLFKHALSRIGLTVVGAFDQISAGGSKGADTKVTVESIKIFGKNQIGMSGVLNLNNVTAGVANWTSITKSSSDGAIFTVESTALNAKIKDAGVVAFASQPDGVTTSEQNVFNVDTKYFMVIPTGNTQMTVEITYYVQTKDDKLAGTVGSRVKNVITKAINVNLENNKAYNLKIILGLTSVKLDAEVAEWEVAGNTDVNLPKNN